MKTIMESIRKTSGLFGLILLLAISVSCQNFFWSHTGGEIVEPPALESCVEYGYLYNWYAATDSRNIANEGWHVPSLAECDTLISYLGGGTTAAAALKESGAVYWNTANGTNTSLFNGRGSGHFAGSSFSALKEALYSWTSTEVSAFFTYTLYLSNITPSVVTNVQSGHAVGNSIRLLKDTTTLSHGETGTYTGNDGKIYPTICIGTQEWVAANLAETLYRNGDPIPTVEDNATWAGLTTGAKAAYDNTYTYVGCDETYDELTTYPTIEYGLLYNGYAATDVREIASSGWHVPTKEELKTMIDYIGGYTVAGGYLKEDNLTYWNSPNTGANNSFDFNARGSGRRLSYGSYSNINEYFSIWTSTVYAVVNAYVGRAFYDQASFVGTTTLDVLEVGNSIRLIKDATTLSHGQTGTYVGNDGKVYQTICIGTQEWLAENLAETKYRNGDVIPEVTDNTTWSNLTTGALCSYNNDWNYVGRTKP